MTTTNHYGKFVDSEVPVTGVHSIHDIDWEWYDFGEEICLTCMEIADKMSVGDSLEDGMDDYPECDSSHTKIIGGWIEVNRLYEPDKTSEFSAIVRETTIQVVWSTTLHRGALCSPCYPGEVDLDSKGDYLAYCLPHHMLNDEYLKGVTK